MLARIAQEHPMPRRGIDMLRKGEHGPLLGCRIGGLRPGPTVLVAGFDPVQSLVSDRLCALPTLPWMRGLMFVIRLEELTPSASQLLFDLAAAEIDRTIILPYEPEDGGAEQVARESYWRVLRMCRDLGMIQGRGAI